MQECQEQCGQHYWKRKLYMKLRTYNHTITQLDRCKVEVENIEKCKKCIFIVVPGNREVLLGMSDIEQLNILNINCNTIGIDKEEKGKNCNMRKGSVFGEGSVQCSVNTGLERSGAKTDSNTSCCTNSGSYWNLKNRPADVLRQAIINNQI